MSNCDGFDDRASAAPRDPGSCACKEEGQREWLGGVPLVIPNLEASDVELEGSSAGRQSGPLHHQLIH
jgi:hypothetical protein